MTKNDRLLELDGIRGIAVLMVILYHYFYRFGSDGFYPYPAIAFFPFSHGFLGVHLFFLVSGFVIAMTLTHSRTPKDFFVKRFCRLWFPMLVCSSLTFFILSIIDSSFTDARRTSILGFIPSLTFTDPSIWKWLSPDINYIDGAYWSLFVEVRFYFWVALVYFALKGRNFALYFVCLSALIWLSYAAFKFSGMKNAAFYVNFIFAAWYIPLFSSGLLFYELHSGRLKFWTIPSILFFFLASLFSQNDLVSAITLASFYTVFFTLIYKREWLAFLKNPVLTGIGLISYSAYLLHQNIGVSVISVLPMSLGKTYLYASALLVACAVLSGAYFVYFYVEKKSSRISKFLIGF
jgi:peptidoglycan/LPS O-acetylase OafA/YrhL